MDALDAIPDVQVRAPLIGDRFLEPSAPDRVVLMIKRSSGFHFANQLAHLFDKLQVFFCSLMFLFLTACVARVCCCWSAAGWGQDFVKWKKLDTKKSRHDGGICGFIRENIGQTGDDTRAQIRVPLSRPQS